LTRERGHEDDWVAFYELCSNEREARRVPSTGGDKGTHTLEAAATRRRPAKGMRGNRNSRRSGRGLLIDPDLRLRFGLSNAPITAPPAVALPQALEFTEGSASRAPTQAGFG
jgi:hypothetical protein